MVWHIISSLDLEPSATKDILFSMVALKYGRCSVIPIALYDSTSAIPNFVGLNIYPLFIA